MPIHGGLLAETVTFAGHGGDVISAYQCQPNNPNCGCYTLLRRSAAS